MGFGFPTTTDAQGVEDRYTVMVGDIEIRLTRQDENLVPAMGRYVAAGKAVVEDFFHQPFSGEISVEVHPNRDALDRHWREAWGISGFASECWMVASGDAHLDLLSPNAWKEDACEHDPADETELQRLITHELVHVFHTQAHPSFDAEAMEAIGWFVEGVAVLASGQADTARTARAREAVTTSQTPQSLATAWSGPYRYAVSGTLVRYVDETFGRATVTRLLSVTSQDELLRELELSESELLRRWREFVLGMTREPCS